MSQRLWRGLILAVFLLGLSGLLVPAQAQSGQGSVLVLTLDGPVAPAMQLYVERGLQMAQDRQVALVVMKLNTPGGSLGTMTNMVTSLRASSVPVVVYVTPRGAMAASAGTIITLAGSLSAMSPETTIGAASPVGSQGEDIGVTMEAKVKEVLKATVRTLTQNRPAAATRAAEDAIDNARALTVDEALQIGLVDFRANDLSDLLNQLEGHTTVVLDRSLTLHTRGAVVEEVGPTFIEQALASFTNPNLVFLLTSLGTLAVLIEIANPGGWVPGFVGAALLLLGFFGMGILDVNWFGLLFIGLAFVLFVLELKTPTHGAMTLAGTVSFITGALVLFNTAPVPGVPNISVPLVIGTGLSIAGLFFGIMMVAVRTYHLPIISRESQVLGQVGVVRTALSPQGQVQVAGETWTARLSEGEEPLQTGTRVKVVAIEGIKLRVKRE